MPATATKEIAAATGSTYTAVNRRLSEGRAQLARAARLVDDALHGLAVEACRHWMLRSDREQPLHLLLPDAIAF